MDDIFITIRRETLTDGSDVYDVHVCQGAARLQIPAVTGAAAREMANKIRAAIGDHSNNRPEIFEVN